jgi:hypothetical protein
MPKRVAPERKRVQVFGTVCPETLQFLREMKTAQDQEGRKLFPNYGRAIDALVDAARPNGSDLKHR